MSLKLTIWAKHSRVRELSMEKESFSTWILRYSTSEHMKMTLMKNVNLNTENRKKMVLSNRAWPEMVKMAFEKDQSTILAPRSANLKKLAYCINNPQITISLLVRSLAEWLRRWSKKLVFLKCVGSNPVQGNYFLFIIFFLSL